MFLVREAPVLDSLSSKQETPAQESSCEYCEILKKIYFGEHLRTAASNATKKNYRNCTHESNVMKDTISFTAQKMKFFHQGFLQ